MTDDAGRARRDDVTQIITSAIDEYERADTATARPDSVADAILAALEQHGLEVVWRDQLEQREPRERD